MNEGSEEGVGLFGTCGREERSHGRGSVMHG